MHLHSNRRKFTECPQTKIPTQGLKVPTASNSVNTGVLRVSPATLKFVNDIDVVAQADGLITNLAVDEGSIGRTGSVLVEIDSRLAESEVKVATKELEAADLKSSDDSNIKFSAATLDVAKWDYTTSLDLFKKGVEGESDHNRRNAWNSSKQAFKSMLQRLRRAETRRC